MFNLMIFNQTLFSRKMWIVLRLLCSAFLRYIVLLLRPLGPVGRGRPADGRHASKHMTIKVFFYNEIWTTIMRLTYTLSHDLKSHNA